MHHWRLVALAYLIGSIPFAVIVSRAMGLADPRSFGSKNPGATNVLRSGNKTAALITLLGDGAKGFVALEIARRLGGDVLPEWTFACVAGAVFLGHLYPVFLKFKGGKGVATFLGITFGLHPILGLATSLTWFIVAVFFRYSSMAALVAGLFAPFYYLFGSGLAWKAQMPMVLALFGIFLGLIWRHRANIQRLRNGTEPRLGKKKPA
jgi:glycerol-3-phosphate acyltransferase PlsY